MFHLFCIEFWLILCAVRMEEVHVFIDGDTRLGGCVLDGFLLNHEGEFGSPIFAFFGVVHNQVPCSVLIAVAAVNDLLGGGMLGHLLQVVATAATIQVVLKIVKLAYTTGCVWLFVTNAIHFGKPLFTIGAVGGLIYKAISLLKSNQKTLVQ